MVVAIGSSHYTSVNIGLPLKDTLLVSHLSIEMWLDIFIRVITKVGRLKRVSLV